MTATPDAPSFNATIVTQDAPEQPAAETAGATKTATVTPSSSPITIILNVTNTADSDSKPKQHVKLDEEITADPVNIDAHMPPPKPHRRKEDGPKSFTASVPQFAIVPVEPAATAAERVAEQPRGASLGAV